MMINSTKLRLSTLGPVITIIALSLMLAIIPERKAEKKYVYPEFYKGVYSGMWKGTSFDRFKNRINYYKKMGLNTVVLNSNKYGTFKKEYIEYCHKIGIHTIARVTVFPGGLKQYPAPPESYAATVYSCDQAIKAGFKEIQLDYIRFTDSAYYHRTALKGITNKEKAEYIESFIISVKSHFRKAKVSWQADVFGRIPVTKNDRIGQRMEKLDKLVDVICPMVYPSYYSKPERKSGAYRIVSRITKLSKKRTKKAKTVLWLQGWRHKNVRHLSFSRFILQQIEAAHDANSDGFIFWNAGGRYNTLYASMRRHKVYAGL